MVPTGKMLPICKFAVIQMKNYINYRELKHIVVASIDGGGWGGVCVKSLICYSVDKHSF